MIEKLLSSLYSHFILRSRTVFVVHTQPNEWQTTPPTSCSTRVLTSTYISLTNHQNIIDPEIVLCHVIWPLFKNIQVYDASLFSFSFHHASHNYSSCCCVKVVHIDIPICFCVPLLPQNNYAGYVMHVSQVMDFHEDAPI